MRKTFIYLLLLSQAAWAQSPTDTLTDKQGDYVILYSDHTWTKMGAVDFNQKEMLAKKAADYKQRFNLICAEEKGTNNQGNGLEALYGTRNFRTILHGAAYRGGGNNYYHRTNKRENKNPLPQDGLDNLANQGFSKAVYLYSENFETAPTEVFGHDNQHMEYLQIGGNTKEELKSLLLMTHEALTIDSVGPVYLHCWNGWHQSGFVSAVLLRQFCDFSAADALHYWENNADTWNRGYSRIKNSIRDFKPYPGLKLPLGLQEEVCPCVDLPNEPQKLAENESEKLRNTLVVVVRFPANSNTITPGVLSALDEYAVLLKTNTYLHVEVGGHSSADGTAAYNLTLSTQRAKTVYNHLVSEGVSPERITFKGYGETKLLDDAYNAGAHTKNRRIEFKITKLNYQINFAKSAYSIPKKSEKDLLVLKEILSANPKVKVEIGGHTDNSGSLEFNKNLSELRAKSVFDFLAERGLSMQNISYKGFGPQSPLVDNNSDENMAKNRRIELILTEVPE